MNEDKIKANIILKIHRFIDSNNLPDNIKDILNNHSYVAGGCIASMVLNENISDYDIYFDSKHNAELICNYCYRNFDTITSDTAVYLKNYDIQFISRFYGNISEIVDKFDYIHCKSYYDVGYGVLFISKETKEAIENKILRYTGSDFPILSMIRTRKFILRGWKISAGEYVKIAYDISQLDMNDPYVLQNQLIGVDIATFNNVIRDLQNKTYDKEILYEILDSNFDELIED